jgi:hypothetical protein
MAEEVSATSMHFGGDAFLEQMDNNNKNEFINR